MNSSFKAFILSTSIVIYSNTVIADSNTDQVHYKLLQSASIHYSQSRYQKAWELFYQIAKSNSTHAGNAQYWIAFMYEQGYGRGLDRIQDINKAKEWYMESSKNGFIQATERLDEILKLEERQKDRDESRAKKIVIEIDNTHTKNSTTKRSENTSKYDTNNKEVDDIFSENRKMEKQRAYEIGYTDGVEWARDVFRRVGYVTENNCIQGKYAANFLDAYGASNNTIENNLDTYKEGLMAGCRSKLSK